MDLGSDGQSAMSWPEYGPHKIRVEKMADPSHDANRCLVNSLQECGLFTLMLCMLISWNLPFGPGPDEHLRAQQMKESLDDFLGSSDASTSPVFLHYAPQLLRCFERNGYSIDINRDPEQQVLELLRQRKLFQKYGSRKRRGGDILPLLRCLVPLRPCSMSVVRQHPL